MKGLLTGKTGQAILTGNVVGEGSGKTFVGLGILVVIIVLIIVVIITKKKKK